VAAFLFRNKFLVKSAEQSARINAEEALKHTTTAVQREKDAVKQLAAKLPAQRERVAKIQSVVDATQRSLTEATQKRDGLKSKYETMKGRVSDAALNAISEEYSQAKKDVTTLEGTLAEAKTNSDDAERELGDIERDLKKAEGNIKTDEGRAELAAMLRETAALRTEVDATKSTLSAIGESRSEIESDLDVARHQNENSKGSKTDREIADAQRQIDADAARKEIEGDLTK